MSDLEYTPTPSVQGFLTSDKFVNLIVGPVGCLSGDTLILTEEGAIPIADITRPMRVLSWNEKTCRYQLSQSSVAFPKGIDYLYRVETPEGGFDAAGSHLLLCADGVYRRVEDLRVGDALSACSGSLPLTSSGFSLKGFPLGAQHCCGKAEGCQGGYEASDRLCGLLSLAVQEGVLELVPSPDDAQTCTLRFSQGGVLLSGGPAEELLRRIHCDLCAYLQKTGGSYLRFGRLRVNVEDCISLVSCGYGGDCDQAHPRSQSNSQYHLQDDEPAQLVESSVLPLVAPCLSTTNRPIIALTRKQVQSVYWDLQVNCTHNYVTVDGAVHHNSTKTTAAIMKIAYEAARVKACRDGVRRSRCVWVRNTRAMLLDSSIPDFLKWFPDGRAGTYQRTNLNFILKFDDVECEVLWRGLDESSDVRRLLSLNVSFGVMDEFREINEDIFNALTGRIGRYPDKSMNGVGCCDDSGKQIHKLWGASNPPDMDTFWEDKISNPPENTAVFIQPSGLSEEADWVKYLPEGYYENLAEGKSDEWISVYVRAEFGKSLSGQPVFRSFDADTHVAKQELRPSPLLGTLWVGIDNGLTPSAVFGQYDFNGRVLVYDAVTSNGMGALRFAREVLKPLIARKYPGYRVQLIADPACNQRAQTDEKTIVDIYKAEGLAVVTAKTNLLVPRIAAVDKYLTRTVDGKPSFLIDPSCKLLIQALRGKYRYKTNTKGETADTPEKNHPISDLADALQYLCLHADGGAVYGAQVGNTPARTVVKKGYIYT